MVLCAAYISMARMDFSGRVAARRTDNLQRLTFRIRSNSQSNWIRIEVERARMKASELAALSLKELRVLQERVEAAILEREKQDRADVRAKLADMAEKAGFSVGELFGSGRNQKRGIATVKFRNPKDPSQTWTGRGRRPNWMVEAGGDVDRFRV